MPTQDTTRSSWTQLTAFITPFGAFCYLTMTFGLRNAGATFQRCMQKCLLKQLGRNAHVYVDDIVVKTEKCGTLLEDLRETFANLRRFQIKATLRNACSEYQPASF